MKKLLIVLPVLLLALGCSKNQPASPVSQQPAKGEIQSIAVEPSYKNANWTMYSDGAVVKVTAQNVQSVEIKYYPTGTNQSEQSLGQATSLSSQQGAWVLSLPQGLMATDLWAESKDAQGTVIKSQGIGNLGYEKLNSYTSPAALGFSISYPESFGFNTSYSKVKSLGYIPVCDQTMAACVFYAGNEYKGTNFENAGVSVNIDKSLNTESKCYNFNVSTNEAQSPVADVTIGGTAFKSATGGSGAAGHFMKTQVYRNFHNGKCYEIAQRLGSTSIGNYEPGTVREFNQEEIWQRLQSIASSFKFNESSKPSTSFDGRLEIVSPKSGDAVDSVFTVTGFAQNWFEGNVSYAVLDANNSVLASGSFTVPDNYEKAAYFTQKLSLSKTPSAATGVLKFSDYSAKDGSLVYSKSVNIKFKNYAQTSLPTGSVIITGTTLCLPHRGVLPGQPQTLECAIGLKEDGTGKLYGLKDSPVPIYDVNLRVQVTGTLEDASVSKYDVVADMKVANVKMLK